MSVLSRCFLIMGLSILLILLLQIGGCGDYSEDLPGGYVFISESNGQREIWPGRHYEGELPSPFSNYKVYIPCNVVDYDYDRQFIIVKQLAQFECFHLSGHDGNPFGPRVNPYNLRDGEAYYWIIKAQRHVIYGPYELNQFGTERKKLGVSNSLKLVK